MFLAEKVYFHHWPPTTPEWSVTRKSSIDFDINVNKDRKHVVISDKTVKVNDYLFNSIKKIGLTIPQFKRQSTMIFEGRCDDFDAHVHITTRAANYLQIFNYLMMWRDEYFPETPFQDSKY